MAFYQGIITETFIILSRLWSDPINICTVSVTFRLSLFAFNNSLILTRYLFANGIISLIHDPVVVILVSSAYIHSSYTILQTMRKIVNVNEK